MTRDPTANDSTEVAVRLTRSIVRLAGAKLCLIIKMYHNSSLKSTMVPLLKGTIVPLF